MRIVVALWLLSFSSLGFAQVTFESTDADAEGDLRIPFELPVYGTPFNARDGAWPSMNQSLAITKDFYYMTHLGVKAAFGRDGLGWGEAGVRGFSLLADIIVTALPGFEAWLHEEYHRAVMSHRGISSFNGVYDLNLGASTIPVRKIDDDDLIRLKRDHPRDMVRLPAAGVEGSLELVTAMETDSFFEQTNLHMSYFYALSYLGVIAYIESGANAEVNELHEDSNEEEEDVEDRDFVGHDFNSWVYDLFRPDEPYDARGEHPSGDGIRRYRDTDDLSDDEKDYLNMIGRLSFLNLLDPQLAGIRRFNLSKDLSFNTNTRHMLTSFGHVVDQNVWVKWREFGVLAKLRNYFNRYYYFPGVDISLYRMKLGGLTVSPRIAGWLQPKNLAFESSTAIPGGLVALRADWQMIFFELLGKTQGWVPSIVYQDRAFLSQVGVRYVLN